METPQLFKPRDFSSLLSDAFNLYLKNIQVIAMAILVYAGPFLLLAGLGLGMFLFKMLGMVSGGMADPEALIGRLGELGGYGLMMFAGAMLGSAALIGVITNFLKMTADQGPQSFTYQELGAAALADLMKNLVASLLAALVIMLGMLFFIFPGIYLAIPMSMIYFIMKFEGKSAGEAFGEALRIIKGHWWSTFGLVLIFGILASILSNILQIPLNGMNQELALGGQPNVIAYAVLMGLATVAGAIGQGLVHMAVGLKYCSISNYGEANFSENLLREIGEQD